MSERRYRPRTSRRRKKRSSRKWPIIVISIFVLTGLVLTGTMVLGYNPFLESQLRTQFGSDFFTDFGNLPATGDGADLEEIIANYEPAFLALENKALNRLESLFEQAIEEYHRQEKSGSADRFRLTNKYIQAGRILENNVDETFYALLTQMESELLRKGYPTEVLTEIENAYRDAKDGKKRELLDRLRKSIGG